MNCTIIPRDYQIDLVDRVRGKVRAGARRVILQGATGSGKTTAAAMLVRAAVDKGSRTLLLAHRRRLIKQMAERLAQFGVPYGVLMADLPDVQDEPWAVRNSHAQVQVASRDTLFSRTIRNEWISFPPADLVLVDEAHSSLEQYATMLQHYPQAVVIGMTATPTRGDGTGLGAYFDALVCTVPTSRLVADGYLVPVSCYAPRRQADGGKRAICGDAVYHWRKFAAGRPTVLFTSKVSASKAAVAAFLAAGIPATHIDAHSTDRERDEAAAGLESGKIKVVGNVAVWGEGVDVPCLSCCVLLRLASSYVTFAQCIGRIMRPYPGKTDAVLIDHSGAVFEHGFPDEDVEWTLNPDETVDARIDRDKKAGKRKEPVCCPRCAYVYSGAVQCPQCGYALFHTPPKATPKKDALLFPVSRDEQAALEREDQERYWKTCLGIVAAKGGKVSQAFAIFKRKFPDGSTRGFRHDPQPGEMRRSVAEVFPGFVRQGVQS